MEQKEKRKKSEENYLLTFDSTHVALAAQKMLTYLSPRMIPTPREISAGCGMTLRFFAEDEQKARKISGALLEYAGLYSLYETKEVSGAYRLVEAF